MHIHYTQNDLAANPRWRMRNFSTPRGRDAAQVKKKATFGSAVQSATEADGGSVMGIV
jgi:hypothetical protein